MVPVPILAKQPRQVEWQQHRCLGLWIWANVEGLAVNMVNVVVKSSKKGVKAGGKSDERRGKHKRTLLGQDNSNTNKSVTDLAIRIEPHGKPKQPTL